MALHVIREPIPSHFMNYIIFNKDDDIYDPANTLYRIRFIVASDSTINETAIETKYHNVIREL